MQKLFDHLKNTSTSCQLYVIRRLCKQAFLDILIRKYTLVFPELLVFKLQDWFRFRIRYRFRIRFRLTVKMSIGACPFTKGSSRKGVLKSVESLEEFTCGKRLDPQSNQARPPVADRGMPSAVEAPGILGS